MRIMQKIEQYSAYMKQAERGDRAENECDKLWTEIRDLIETIEQDALRYRWLRQNNYGGISAQMIETYCDEELDAAIDKEIEK